MNDVLAELSMLSQVLQRSSLTIRQAQCQIQWAVEGLQLRKEKADKLYPLTSDTFRSVALTDRIARLTSRLSIPRAQFLQAIIDRLQQRLIVVDDNKSLSVRSV